MKEFDGVTWIVTGCHPVALPLGGGPQMEHVVRPKDQLKSKVDGAYVRVFHYNAEGEFVRDLGYFEWRSSAPRSLTGDVALRGVKCSVELTLALVARKRSVLSATVFALPGSDLEDEGAVGGWSAEAQGGVDGGG